MFYLTSLINHCLVWKLSGKIMEEEEKNGRQMIFFFFLEWKRESRVKWSQHVFLPIFLPFTLYFLSIKKDSNKTFYNFFFQIFSFRSILILPIPKWSISPKQYKIIHKKHCSNSTWVLALAKPTISFTKTKIVHLFY